MNAVRKFFDPSFLTEAATSYLDWMDRHYSLRRKICWILFGIHAIIMGGYLSHFLIHTQPYLPSVMVEQVLEENGARNFAERGFAKNGFLVDYSSSPNEEDHPYLYTHMPSGPTVLLGALRKANFDILESRFVYAGITLLGATFVFLLMLQITAVPEISLLAFVLFTLDYVGFIKFSDHYVHSFGYLSYFGSMYFYLLNVQRPTLLRYLAFLSCISISFLTSFLSCIPLVVTIAVLHFGFFRKGENARKIFFSALGACAFWGSIHFGRNCWVFGVDVAFKDFLYTLTNRIAAWPSKEALMSFFAENRIVLWGVGKVLSENLNDWLSGAILGPSQTYYVPSVIVLILLVSLKIDVRNLIRTVGLICTIFLGTYAWHVIFYAQGTNYMFPPIFRMFKIGASTSAMLILAHGVRSMADFIKRDALHLRNAYPLFALLLIFSGTVLWVPLIVDGKYQNKLVVRAARNGYEPGALASYERIKSIPAGTIISNIDALMVNFFVRNLTFGGCDRAAIENLDVSGCPSSFVAETTKANAEVKYIFLNREFVPGYQKCFGECLKELDAALRSQHAVVDEDPEKWVLFGVNGAQKIQQSAK